MKVDVLLGLQWGDEGKGKIVDVLSVFTCVNQVNSFNLFD